MVPIMRVIMRTIGGNRLVRMGCLIGPSAWCSTSRKRIGTMRSTRSPSSFRRPMIPFPPISGSMAAAPSPRGAAAAVVARARAARRPRTAAPAREPRPGRRRAPPQTTTTSPYVGDYKSGKDTPDGYNIDLKFAGTGWTDVIKQYVIDAAEHLSDVIRGDLPGFTSSMGTIDDILVTVTLTTIDGSGGFAGWGGTTASRSGVLSPRSRLHESRQRGHVIACLQGHPR